MLRCAAPCHAVLTSMPCDAMLCRAVQTQAPVLEVDEGEGEDFVAEQLRALQEQANDLQLRHDKAAMELQEAQLKEDQ